MPLFDSKPALDRIDLHGSGDGQVHVFPQQDYDAFVMSQREAVESLKMVHQAMSSFARIKEQIDELFMDIVSWGRANKGRVQKIIWSPRTDDVLVTVIGKDEDAEGDLHDALAMFQLQVFDSRPFRLSFLLIRPSEVESLDSFVNLKTARDLLTNA